MVAMQNAVVFPNMVLQMVHRRRIWRIGFCVKQGDFFEEVEAMQWNRCPA